MIDFVVVSDLHIDVNPFDVSIFDSEVNINKWLVIAGDTFTGTPSPAKYIVGFATKCAKFFKGVFLVLGNHDYYSNTIEETKNEVRKYLELSPATNIVFLDGDTVFEIPDSDVVVYGDTWWSHMPRGIEKNIEDYMRIKSSLGHKHLTFEETNIINNITTEKIKSFLCDEKYVGKNKVIITHFPFLYFDSGYPISWLTNYFHNEHLSHWLDEDWMDNVIWIYGHDHQINFEKVKNTYFFTNARGYKKSEYTPHILTVG